LGKKNEIVEEIHGTVTLPLVREVEVEMGKECENPVDIE